MQVWVNKDSDENVGKIAAHLEAEIAKKDSARFKSFFIFIVKPGTDAETSTRLQALADANKLNRVAFAYVADNDSSLQDYQIDTKPEVKNTVMVYANRKVVANFVNLASDEEGLKKLDAAVDEATSGGLP